jgi:uncharacterized membrane protein (UPF0127 family)
MAGTWRLRSEWTGDIVVERLEIADGFWSRLVGLQFRRAMPAGTGLLLVPCNSLHTCFVRFPLDVVFLDAAGRVLRVQRDLAPWRLAWGPRGSHAALEVCAGLAHLSVGETLRLETTDTEQQPFPKSLEFLRKPPDALKPATVITDTTSRVGGGLVTTVPG